MKKFGFTLAEVLITLGIIGVISALTMPTFTQKTQNSKIGPAVSKTSNAFTQAMKAVMAEAEADNLRSTYVCADGTTTCASRVLLNNDSKGTALFKNIARYLDGHYSAGSTTNAEQPIISQASAKISTTDLFVFSDGAVILFNPALILQSANFEGSDKAPQHNIYASSLIIDINGAKGPNKYARDQFQFWIMEDGSLLPYGVVNAGTYNTTTVTTGNQWTTRCPNNTAAPTDSLAMYCTASIFANGLKVEYK